MTRWPQRIFCFQKSFNAVYPQSTTHHSHRHTTFPNKSFLIFYTNKIPRNIVLCEFIFNFVVSWVFYPSILHILMKVFSLLSLTRNLENFTNKRITTTLIICIGMRPYAVPSTGVGSCYRLFLVGHSRASRLINGINSTLSFWQQSIWELSGF